jgi:hypothetical protein
MRRVTIAGLIAALTLGTFVLVASVLVASAQATPPPLTQLRAPFWPAISSKSVVTEWYSDIPWHQKLGTFAGNEIDEALVLPYQALGTQEITFCTKYMLSQEDCMIETGINNILGIFRTDTPYDPNDTKIKAATKCQSYSQPCVQVPQCQPSQPCIEVKLALSMFWARSTGSAVELQPRPFGVEPAMLPYSAYIGPDYGAYVITDGTSYAPQMPWYMAHYCDSQFSQNAADTQDPVCYGDYFSPMNDGFNPLPMTNATAWPKSQPWSVFPTAAPPAPLNHCKSGLTTCTLVMAGFDLFEVPENSQKLQYYQYNNFLFQWFNGALANFPINFTIADLQRHFPWSGTQVTWGDGSPTDLYPQAQLNPFLGQFNFTGPTPGSNQPAGCDINLTGPKPPATSCANTGELRADHYLYPRQCTLADLAGTDIPRLRACGLNYELHHNGYLLEWPMSFWSNVQAAGMLANQYGRTSFLFAGVPGMQLPVSFYNIPSSVSGLSVYQQVYNASIFSLYLPIANEADFRNAYHGRNYTEVEFYHTLLMSNHMESDPDEFAEGIRGKVLWHDEYRTQKMYEASNTFGPRMFAAAFNPQTAPAPFHNNTCDACHVRNGSGIPINTTLTLDAALQPPQGFMTGATYNPYPVPDYTFTGTIRPMKLVFFDLKRVTSSINDSVYSEPLAFSPSLVARTPNAVKTADLYYKNTIMNFYGDSFHATRPGYNYTWSYGPANSTRMVVNTARVNSELAKTYQPLQVNLGAFQTDPLCQLVTAPPNFKPWPANCNDINTAAIHKAIDTDLSVGFMHLNGKRLGNLSAIEAIPDEAVVDFYQNQVAALGAPIAGEILWNAGSRDGVDGDVKKVCRTKSLTDCYIGRFGWLGDRVSLEDQVANAAFVEMNMTTSAGFKKLYPTGNVMFPIRYNFPNCGPADKTCVGSKGNADLSELDIDRMAAYARWLGNPTRSEFTASLPDVVAGETIFGQLQCNTCHVISKIEIVPDHTMLSKVFRDRLATRVAQSSTCEISGGCASPFLSYLGTDLLMHDMGYLSQVSNASQSIRDNNGVVLPAFQNSVQKIRTPALKGLRFNRFVTDSQMNTNNPCSYLPTAPPCDPACDFLLHDGRACDAIEAAFLHDGPAIKKLGVIGALNALTPTQLMRLRAFLYSL